MSFIYALEERERYLFRKPVEIRDLQRTLFVLAFIIRQCREISPIHIDYKSRINMCLLNNKLF